MGVRQRVETFQDDSSMPLHRSLDRIDIFKWALRSSLGVDLRVATRPVRDEIGEIRSERFSYLPEVVPFLQPRVNTFDMHQRRAYEAVKDDAVASFWQIYADFLSYAGAAAVSAGIEAERAEPVLGRAILLFEVSRGTRFVTYLEKTLREAVKNLRGHQYAERLGIPVSAGRLVPQIRWQLDQRAAELRRGLSVEEAEQLVVNFLRGQSARFGEATMRRIALNVYQDRSAVSLETCRNWLEPSVGIGAGGSIESSSHGNDCYVERSEEHRYQLQQIHDAIELACFDESETALVLSELELPYDERARQRLASTTSPSALRKRIKRLLVKLLAARYAPSAPKFGELIHLTAGPGRGPLVSCLHEVGTDFHGDYQERVDQLLNWMSLSSSVYRLSINERARGHRYLVGEDRSLDSVTFSKLLAVLVEQERLGFPCWDQDTAFV